MRLLQSKRSRWPFNNTHTFRLVDYKPREVPSYAILSHRWGSDEVTYQDIQDGTYARKVGGYKKLEFCAQQVARDGLTHFWVDTCCIDKTNNTELSEAINSMFKWCQRATRCYVYLPDVRGGQGWDDQFRQSVWFERGWTLPELIAPKIVEFFSVEGTKLGDKESLKQEIHQITGISVEVLEGKALAQVDDHERFSWSVRRRVTVEEDEVYCLLGIFDICMPLLYGEGLQKALDRLRRKIRIAADPSLDLAKNAPWEVPFERNELFTGRETQLAHLQDILFARDSPPRTAITGLGGTGKTQLVLELVYRTQTKYPNCAILWISTTTEESLRLSYLAVARQLSIAGCNEKTANVPKLVQDHLNRDTAGQWLLVFDNADDLEMWTSAAPTQESGGASSVCQSATGPPRRLIDYLPWSERGRTVFTTRNREVAVRLARSNVVALPEMDGNAAAELFRKMLTNPQLADNCQNVSALLSALTNLPLAISQAAAYINMKGASVVEYLSLLQEQEDVIIDLLSEDFEDHGRYYNIRNPIATTWLVSFEQIRRSDPLAAEYLSFIACVNYRDVPQSLLPRGLSRKKEMDAIGTLEAYSFITRRPESVSLDLHRLVHLTTRNWLRQENLLHQCTERATAHLAVVFPAPFPEQRAIWREYLPHAQQILASDLLSPNNEQRVGLMEKCGLCLYEDGRWVEAEQLLSQVSEIRKVVFGDNHAATLISLDNLARVLLSRGQYSEAEEIYSRTLAAREKELRPSHPDTLDNLSSLAIVLHAQGREKESEEMYRRVLRERERKSLD